MFKTAFTLLTLIACLQGCTMLRMEYGKQDIPARPIIEEQDTPFVFKQAYQTEGLYATQVYLENQNDFVDIAPSVQYVWWTPSASEDVFAVIEAPAQAQTLEDAVDAQNAPASDKAQDSETEADDKSVKTMPAPPILSTQPAYQCAMIYCDGHDTPCGAIRTCDGNVCDAKKRDEYTCLDELCTKVQAKTIIEVAKGEIKCPEFPERYMCSQSTDCKFKPLPDGTVSIKDAQKLFAGEEDE